MNGHLDNIHEQAEPDRNGVELYRDRPREEWPRTPTGELAMSTKRLDMAALLAEAGA